jgi:hypothetical protein
MSKRHQASRRRSYGRRQHEVHERPDRLVGVMESRDEIEFGRPADRWDVDLTGREAVAGSAARGID